MGTYLITGANRGIGFEMTRLLLERGDKVIAACRTASSELFELGADVLENVDVSKPESIQEMANGLKGQPIDVLINNAGILRDGMLVKVKDGEIVVNGTRQTGFYTLVALGADPA